MCSTFRVTRRLNRPLNCLRNPLKLLLSLEAIMSWKNEEYFISIKFGKILETPK